MKKIRSSKKGFTLAELLIVVAIIGVLVGISIPIFSAQLEKSREATDVANLRAAKAAVTAAWLDGSIVADDDGNYAPIYYNADEGKLDSSVPAVKYGQGTDVAGNTATNWKYGDYTASTVAKDKVIKITVSVTNGEPKFTYAWA